MTLDINFNEELEPIINSFEPLADWFERNQDTMAYFGLTHSDCLHLEDGIAHHDLVALGRMANAALNCLEENFGIDNKAHAMAATISLMAVYAQEEDQLSEVAKEKYRVNGVEELLFDPSQAKEPFQLDNAYEILKDLNISMDFSNKGAATVLGKTYELNPEDVIDDPSHELHISYKEKRR